MMTNNMIVRFQDLINSNAKVEIKGHGWYPARPINNCKSLFERIRESWLVFTGKADAFIWPQDSLK